MSQERANKARAHYALMEELYKEETIKSIENSVVYDHECEISFIPKYKTEIIFEDMDSVEAAITYGGEDSAILNFASYRHPGGGFINGAMAQEEALCHASNLYNVLEAFNDDFYAFNQDTNAFYSNKAIYSPDIVFSDKAKCSVITCASPNKSAARLAYHRTKNFERLNRLFLRERIRFILNIAAEQNTKTLILGAFGCGVFGQNPEAVASIFKNFLYNQFRGIFERAVFAVPNSATNPASARNHEAFKRYFGS